MAKKCPKCHSENTDTARFCSNCATSLTSAKTAPPLLTKTLQSPARVVAPGTVFADRYEILGNIGAGGMGEVYRALDKNLGRHVAIKILPAAFAEDKERMARFEREAKLLAVLNHSNIAAIHGLEESEGRRFLVLELAEGETLQDRLDRGALTVEEALETCRELAEGLEAAHEKGIVHRDLKPGNIMITPEGKVKILDFGLAKAYGGETTRADIAHSPTVTAQMTEPGVILGTAAYMSPEQARGRAVDKRADIWAFGCIVYECLTGKRAFQGETVSDTLAQILKGEPDWSALPANTPANIRTLLRRCLQKDSKNRFRDIGDARIEIEEAGFHPAEVSAGIRRFPLASVLAGGAVLLIAGVLIGHLILGRKKPLPSAKPVTSIVKLEPGHSLAGLRRPMAFNWPSRTAMAISRDGAFIVYCAVNDDAGPEAKSQLFMRRFDSLEAKPIPGTEGGIAPFLSPDDRWIGFWADGKLRKVSIEGGVPQDLCEIAAPFGANWGEDESIVFSNREDTGLLIVSSRGGKPEALTTPDFKQGEFNHRLPFCLPGRKNVLFTIMRGRFDVEPRIAILDVDTRAWRVLIDDASDARYIPTGHIVFTRRGTLMAVPFDLQKLDVRGQPVAIVPDVLHSLNDTHFFYNTSAAQYTISDSGSLVYAPGGIIPNRKNSLVWVDRNGNEKSISSSLEPYFAPRLSLDGRKILYKSTGTENHIRLYDIERDMSTPLISKGSCDWPIWTPNGKGIVFSWMDLLPPPNIYMQPADGSGPMERLTTSEYFQEVSSLSPDGRQLAFVESKDSEDILIYDFQTKKTIAFSATEHNEVYPEYSPDGRWLAYVTDQEGRFEVYVRSSTGVGETVKVSREGGRLPLWARSGKQLFFRSIDYTMMMAVDVQTGPRFSAGKPRLLFEKGGLGSSTPIRGYDISLDDQRFLMVKLEERKPRPVTELILIQNWFEELKRLAPTK